MSIVLAHGGDAGGFHSSETLIVSGAIALLGLILLFNKNAKRPVAAGMLVLGAAGVAFALFASGEPAPAGEVTIASPADGTEVPAGEPVDLAVEVSGTRGSVGGSGHLHVFIDGELDQMPHGDIATIELERGEHEITVEYVDASHVSFDPPVTHSITLVAT